MTNKEKSNRILLSDLQRLLEALRGDDAGEVDETPSFEIPGLDTYFPSYVTGDTSRGAPNGELESGSR